MRHCSFSACWHLSCVLLLLLMQIIFQSTFSVHGQIVKTICTLPIPLVHHADLHADFAIRHYAPSFPGVTFKYKLLGHLTDGFPFVSAKSMVSSWVVNGSDCDMMIGPGFSFLGVALSPLMSIPWLDFSATSTTLSDKSAHPMFSRTIPTDAIGAEAAVNVIDSFGWKSINMFCVDDAYGRSVAAAVSTSIAKIGGHIEVSRCVNAAASRQVVQEAMDAFLASKTRVVFAALILDQLAWVHFLNISLEKKLYKNMVVFMSEGACSAGDKGYLQMTGALCATYAVNQTRMDPFMASYRLRDTTWVVNELKSLGFTDTMIDVNGTNIFAAFSHDAAYHMMAAMHSYITTGQTGDEVQYLRYFQSEGVTGRVILNSDGDRATADVVVFNAQELSDGTLIEKTIGYVLNGNFTFPDPTAPEQLYFFGEYHPGDAPPKAELVSVTEDKSNVGLIVGLVVAAVVIIAVAAIVAAGAGGKSKDNSAAPKNSEEPFVIVFTDIQTSTALWAREPEVMSESVERHHEEIRKLISLYKGYEVKTIGDSFMCAFTDPKNATKFAVAIQSTLFHAVWAPEVDQTYKELQLEGENAKLLPEEAEYGKYWNGLRVRVGVHYGLGTVKFDEVQLSYDYYGTVVNTAARIEAAAHGGQVVISEATLKSIGYALEDTMIVDLGVQPLRGLDESVQLHQILPMELTSRQFPPLRLDVEDVIAEADEIQSVMGTQVSSMGSTLGVDALAEKYAKHLGGNNLRGNAARLTDLHAYTKALFSTCQPVWRTKTVGELAKKWRTPLEEKQLKNDAKGMYYEVVMMNIVAKVAKTVEFVANKTTYVEELPGEDGFDGEGKRMGAIYKGRRRSSAAEATAKQREDEIMPDDAPGGT